MSKSRILEHWSHSLDTLLESVGRVTVLLAHSGGFMLRGRIRWVSWVDETVSIGVQSLPMVLMISFIAGSVLSLQTAQKFAQTGAETYVGGLVSLAITREIAPIFTALTVGARAGTAIASQIANMQVSEQIAALRIMHVSPIRYLVVPKLMAAFFSLPLLTMLSIGTAILGGMLIAKSVTNLHYSLFLDSIWLMLKPYDIWVSLLKAGVFGVLLAGICCNVGLMTQGGAKDVGQSTTKAAVWSSIAIMIADFFLSWLFFGSSYELGR
ncbi:MAG: ABC transporter permease [Candidatus Melainabacteria bacterium]|nr:ABC transporter permease [Candidatus Melainabacteria bacterium]